MAARATGDAKTYQYPLLSPSITTEERVSVSAFSSPQSDDESGLAKIYRDTARTIISPSLLDEDQLSISEDCQSKAMPHSPRFEEDADRSTARGTQGERLDSKIARSCQGTSQYFPLMRTLKSPHLTCGCPSCGCSDQNCSCEEGISRRQNPSAVYPSTVLGSNLKSKSSELKGSCLAQNHQPLENKRCLEADLSSVLPFSKIALSEDEHSLYLIVHYATPSTGFPSSGYRMFHLMEQYSQDHQPCYQPCI